MWISHTKQLISWITSLHKMVSRHKIYQDQKKLFIKYYHISMILSSNHFFLTVLKAQCAGADVLLVASSALGDLFHFTSGSYLFNHTIWIINRKWKPWCRIISDNSLSLFSNNFRYVNFQFITHIIWDSPVRRKTIYCFQNCTNVSNISLKILLTHVKNTWGLVQGHTGTPLKSLNFW